MHADNRVLAVMVTYYPDDGLQERVAALLDQVDELLIVDNTPESTEPLRKLAGADEVMGKLTIRTMGSNAGVAAALNIGVTEATRRKFGLLLTLDQDSNLPPFAVERMRAILASAPDVAVACPLFFERFSGRRSYIPVKKGWLRPQRIKPNSGHYDVYSAITSGSLYKTLIFDLVGGFANEYFVDSVDTEFSLRIIRKKFRIVVASDVDMSHSFGNRAFVNRLGVSIATANYPPIRHYYQARNRVFLYKKYGLRFPLYVLYDLSVGARNLMRMLLAERGKKEKLAMMARGFADGLRGRGGPYARP